MKTKRPITPSEAEDVIDRIAKGLHLSADLECIISYLHSSGDVGQLWALLESDDEDIIGDGVYILSELGKSGTPLREKAKMFLSHSDAQIRYWAMNSVISCFEAKEAKHIVTAAGLLDDSDEFVRTRAREMLAALR
jgi:hypothetical protein